MRGYAFKFAEITKGLSGLVVNRDTQKATCSKEFKDVNAYESCSLGAGTGRVRFIWQLFFGDAPQDSLRMDQISVQVEMLVNASVRYCETVDHLTFFRFITESYMRSC